MEAQKGFKLWHYFVELFYELNLAYSSSSGPRFHPPLLSQVKNAFIPAPRDGALMQTLSTATHWYRVRMQLI